MSQAVSLCQKDPAAALPYPKTHLYSLAQWFAKVLLSCWELPNSLQDVETAPQQLHYAMELFHLPGGGAGLPQGMGVLTAPRQHTSSLLIRT